MKRLLTTCVCALCGLFAGCEGDVGKDVEKAGTAAAKKLGDAASTVKEKTGEAAAVVKEKAGEAVEAAKDLTVGGVNVGTEMTALFEKVKTALSDVKDSETAEKAEAELKEADTTLAGLLEKAEKLPEAARPALTSMMQKGLAALKPLIDKVLSIDGVGAKLKPLLDGLVARLQGAAGEKQ